MRMQISQMQANDREFQDAVKKYEANIIQLRAAYEKAVGDYYDFRNEHRRRMEKLRNEIEQKEKRERERNAT